MLNDHCHRVSTHLQSINIVILLSLICLLGRFVILLPLRNTSCKKKKMHEVLKTERGKLGEIRSKISLQGRELQRKDRWEQYLIR